MIYATFMIWFFRK